MDNGTLVFIVIIEAIVIVWQASKLKQYSKIEHLLNKGSAGEDSSSSSSSSSNAQSAKGGAGASIQATPAMASQASQSVASAISSDDDDDEDLLDMAGVDPEDNIEEAKRVQLVMARCRYAEFYLEQLDDEYERGQFQRIVNSCKNTASNISDPFFRSSALQPLVLLLDRAEWTRERDELLSEIDDELVRQQLSEKLSD